KKRNRVVLFGGGKDNGKERYNDTWEWDGIEWKEIK
ncbi:MAG: kelch repeat-containing protein, partial [Bacteroidota bacterium]